MNIWHIIMQLNLSPETIVKNKLGEPVVVPTNLADLVAGTQDTSFAHNHDYSMAATGVCFVRDHQGLLPNMCESLYAGRKKTKSQSLKYKAMHEEIVAELHHRGVDV